MGTQKEKTPYQLLMYAIVKFEPGARRIADLAGPNEHSTLEFWSMPNPKPGRLVIIQKWKGDVSSGGFDVYFQQQEHRTMPAIAEILGRYVPELPHEKVPHGLCPVCGHHGDDCTGQEE